MIRKNALRGRIALLSAVVLLALGSEALASTLTQNLSWTIDRSGTTT